MLGAVSGLGLLVALLVRVSVIVVIVGRLGLGLGLRLCKGCCIAMSGEAEIGALDWWDYYGSGAWSLAEIDRLRARFRMKVLSGPFLVSRTGDAG